MKKHSPANKQSIDKTERRGGKRSTSWKPGQSGNPKGSPKRGESWRELYAQIGNMTGDEAYKFCELIGKQVRNLTGVTLKQAVVLRVYTALLFEPDARLLNAAMDRDEGKVAQPIEMTWREQAQKLGYDPERLIDELEAELAARGIGGGSLGSNPTAGKYIKPGD